MENKWGKEEKIWGNKKRRYKERRLGRDWEVENKWEKEEQLWGNKKRRNAERRLGIDEYLKKCRDGIVKKKRDEERRKEEMGSGKEKS